MVGSEVFEDALDDGVWHWNVVHTLYEAIANQLVEALIELRLFAGQLAVAACLEDILIAGLSCLFEDRRFRLLSNLSGTLLNLGFDALLHLLASQAFTGQVESDFVMIDHVFISFRF